MELERRNSNAPDLRRIGLHPDFWYPLARSRDVPPGKTRLAMYAGEPIVVARSGTGNVFALDDRCAHRQFPLHKGVVSGETLKCAYHAWCYQPDGRVAGVPYLPKEACRPAGVKSYACREAHGYVFVFTGDRQRAAEVPFPRLPPFDNGRRRTMHFWRQVRCHYSFMHENLMDMNHQFLHRGIMGTIKPTLLDYESGPDWVEARYRFQRGAGAKGDRGAGFMTLGGSRRNGAATTAGNGARGNGASGNGASHGAEPGDLMTIRTQYPYQTLSLRRGGAAEPAFELWVAYVPDDRQQRSHISVGMLMIEKPPLPFLLHLFWPFIRRFTESVFTEDRMAVEAEQRAYDLQQADWNQEINPVILSLRDVLARNGVPLR
jgi:phenylpropionate dioxygenase-like ring-hydroxylating dioxygenase large terminal subunit